MAIFLIATVFFSIYNKSLVFKNRQFICTYMYSAEPNQSIFHCVSKIVLSIFIYRILQNRQHFFSSRGQLKIFLERKLTGNYWHCGVWLKIANIRFPRNIMKIFSHRDWEEKWVSSFSICRKSGKLSDILKAFQRCRHLRSRVRALLQGLPDFSWYNIPKRGKIYKITTKFTKFP
jgi:hypothetical protein